MRHRRTRQISTRDMMSRPNALWLSLATFLVFSTSLCLGASARTESSIAAKPRTGTHRLLTQLGMSPDLPPVHRSHHHNHHHRRPQEKQVNSNSLSSGPRKRLAESSRASSLPDSHMFIIKLPASHSYYTRHDILNKAGLQDPKSRKKIGVNFRANGKPARVYHWNMPLLKTAASKAAAARRRHTSMKASKRRIHENDVLNTTYEDFNGLHAGDDGRKSYYSPPKSLYHKYFPGNGKPNRFYVIGKSNNRKKKHS